MIFVSVGTNEAGFDRLLRLVAEVGPADEVLVQHGHSSPVGPPHATFRDFLAFDEMAACMRRASHVVTHAGVGSVMVALANGRRPIVLPRRKAQREAVDDHQLQLARRFAAAGLVTVVESAEELADALARPGSAEALATGSSPLAAELRQFVLEAGAGGAPAQVAG